jgi:outer membrane protein assembly factor BamD (BamD/ComL family)
MKIYSILIVSVMLFVSCAIPQKTTKTDVNINSPEFKLKEARLTLSKGDFQGAVDLYLLIYNNDTIDPIYREEALYNLGMMYSGDAASIDEYEIALKYLRQLSSDFPKTQYKEKTNREIRYIRNQIKRLKQK